MWYALAAIAGAVAVWLAQIIFRPRWVWAERYVDTRNCGGIRLRVRVPERSNPPVLITRAPWVNVNNSPWSY